jgi:hypothetical protein
LRSTFATRSANKSELVPAASPRGELAWAVIPAIALGVVLGATRQRIETRERHMRTMDHSGMERPMSMPPQPSTPRP